jgi:hypothetical protein
MVLLSSKGYGTNSSLLQKQSWLATWNNPISCAFNCLGFLLDSDLAKNSKDFCYRTGAFCEPVHSNVMEWGTDNTPGAWSHVCIWGRVRNMLFKEEKLPQPQEPCNYIITPTPTVQGTEKLSLTECEWWVPIIQSTEILSSQRSLGLEEEIRFWSHIALNLSCHWLTNHETFSESSSTWCIIGTQCILNKLSYEWIKEYTILFWEVS